MKTLSFATIAALAASAFAGDAQAQTATMTVGYEVTAINKLTVAGSPSLVINDATAGGGLTSATGTASYAITTNQTNRKITAKIDSNMPTKVTLGLHMAAPTGGSSAGSVNLTSVDQDMVTGIGTVNQSGLTMTYELNAVVGAGVVAAGNKTVTFTITAGA